jgi:glucose/arabinose dehydrogenase
MRRCLFSAGCLLFLVQAFAVPVGAAPPDDLVLVPLISGLNSPVAVRHAGDGRGRLFIVEQAGVIRIWDGTGLVPTPFLNISSIVDSEYNEQGLLGLAFHPNYASNGYFYVNYTYDPGAGLDRTRIARYSVSAGNPDVADTAETVILEIEQDFSNHNGGDIHFGPDGYLYICMGDGGSGGDPNDRAQDRTKLLGKMLRIDVDGATRKGRGFIEKCGLVQNYDIPVDNPFVGDGNACDEIWAYGMRNPWRFSFDRQTGALFIGDVGQELWEEIDFQPAASSGGENYGWRCYEGTHEYNLTGCSGPFVDPILEYSQASGGCSVTGGYSYRGHGIAGFGGTYVYGDYCSGKIWFALPAGGWSAVLWDDTSLGISTFGEDEDGEIYVADLFGGTVSRFESPSTIFVDGFESGDTSGW